VSEVEQLGDVEPTRRNECPRGTGTGEQRSEGTLGDGALQRRGREEAAADDAPTNCPPEHDFLECDRRHHGQQYRELPALALEPAPSSA
jgi:hypothetical protein